LRSGTVDVEGLFTSRAGKVIHSGEVEIAGAVSGARAAMTEFRLAVKARSPSTFFAASRATARL